MTIALLSGLAGAASTAWWVGMALDAFGAPPAIVESGWAGAWAALQAGLVPTDGGLIGVPIGLLSGLLIGAACLRTLPEPARPLAWDGQAWHWAGQMGRATVAVDLLDWMLVRFEPAQGATVWLPLSEAGAGAAWPGIRAALYWPEPSAVGQVFRGHSTGSVS